MAVANNIDSACENGDAPDVSSSSSSPLVVVGVVGSCSAAEKMVRWLASHQVPPDLGAES